MLSEEEKKAIDLLEDIKNNSWTTKYIMSNDSKNADILLNLITKLQKENEEKDKEIKELKQNIDYQVLCDFLISSVSNEEPPIWTEKHIEELLENFEMRWKNAYK